MWYRDPDSLGGPGGLANLDQGHHSAFYTDGIDWQEEPDYRLEGSPNIFTLPDGRLRRYYLARRDQP